MISPTLCLNIIMVLLTDEIHLLFDNQDCEVYFKLYLLLYADDTVIFAETAHDLQKALPSKHFL